MVALVSTYGCVVWLRWYPLVVVLVSPLMVVLGGYVDTHLWLYFQQQQKVMG